MTRARNFLAFAVAPLWVPLLVAATLMLTDPYVGQDNEPALSTVVSAVVTYAGILLIGLPAFLFLRARGWTSWKLAVALGFAAGVVMLVVFGIAFGFSFGEDFRQQLLILQQESLISNVIACPATGALGALVGTTLWLIARPDRR